jgi:1,4-alpha-glucan branching enzyme
MIAEESTSFPKVSRPVSEGGLGFTMKWNMGWMHDSLDYFSLDPLFRKGNHNKLTFSLLYAFTENFVLPYSHDEVVHGKHSLLDRMPGDYEQKFANLRALYTYMFTHPGKKLLFMGGEFAQWIEWNCNAALDWHLTAYPKHGGIQNLVAELNGIYKANPPLWEEDFSPEAFQWLDCEDSSQSIYSYMRKDKKGNVLVIILNLTPVVRNEYFCGVPFGGEWEEIFSSDDEKFGGTGISNKENLYAVKGKYQGEDHTLKVRLPWLGGIILRKKING